MFSKITAKTHRASAGKVVGAWIMIAGMTGLIGFAVASHPSGASGRSVMVQSVPGTFTASSSQRGTNELRLRVVVDASKPSTTKISYESTQVVNDANQAAADSMNQANNALSQVGGGSGAAIYDPPFDAQIIALNQAMAGFVDPVTGATETLSTQVFNYRKGGSYTRYIVELTSKVGSKSTTSYACALVSNHGNGWSVTSGRCR